MASQLSLGDLIQRQRAALGLTQARLAELVGRSPSTVRSWERDRGVPGDKAALTALMAVLGLTDEEVENAIGDQEGAADESVGPGLIPLIDAPFDEPTRSPLPPKRTELFPRREPAVHDSRPIPADLPFGEEASAPAAAELIEEPESPLDRVDSPIVADPVAGEDVGDFPEAVSQQQPEPSVDRVDSPIVADPEVGVGVSEPPASARLQIPAPAERRGPVTVPAPVVSTEQTAVTAPTDSGTSAVSLRSRPASYLDDPDELRTYRTRMILTAILLVLMFIVLTWAFGEARDAFGLIFDEPAL